MNYFYSLNLCMDFHQIFSIALPWEDQEFVSFQFLFANNCCHSKTFQLFGVVKVLTSIKLNHVHQFSSNCFLIIPSNWAGVPACVGWLFLKRVIVCWCVCVAFWSAINNYCYLKFFLIVYVIVQVLNFDFLITIVLSVGGILCPISLCWEGKRYITGLGVINVFGKGFGYVASSTVATDCTAVWLACLSILWKVVVFLPMTPS